MRQTILAWALLMVTTLPLAAEDRLLGDKRPDAFKPGTKAGTIYDIVCLARWYFAYGDCITEDDRRYTYVNGTYVQEQRSNTHTGYGAVLGFKSSALAFEFYQAVKTQLAAHVPVSERGPEFTAWFSDGHVSLVFDREESGIYALFVLPNGDRR